MRYASRFDDLRAEEHATAFGREEAVALWAKTDPEEKFNHEGGEDRSSTVAAVDICRPIRQQWSC